MENKEQELVEKMCSVVEQFSVFDVRQDRARITEDGINVLIALVREHDGWVSDKKFPVLGYAKHEGCPAFVKWSELDDEWAIHVHSQTLKRLAELGGLSPVEIVFNVNKLEWATKVCPKFAVDLVKRLAPPTTEKE